MQIGLTIFTETERGSDVTCRYATIRAAVRQAEADGFDSIWLPDHLLYEVPGGPTRGAWESWTLLSALAEATERVQIGSLVACNTFRHPAVLAKMATAIDEVSAGRFVLGVGAGWSKLEHRSFGLPVDRRFERFEEALHIIGPMLRDGHVDFTGRHYQARDCQDLPRGPRAAGPPLLIGGRGPRAARLAAHHADLWNVSGLGAPETIAEPLAMLETACRDAGRDRATIGMTASIGLRFPGLDEGESVFEAPLTGTPADVAAAMHGYAELGLAHIMLICEPFTAEARSLAAEALRMYRGQAGQRDGQRRQVLPSPIA
jgi:alkanesulfonate monooxygenase SsuD/methylene tetrahydromethanopterin reductase-like flavin-dependent oxidoreductase (luciferase family)